jgi:hypothetical protein
LPSIGALIVVLGFFLPWVLVSCSISLDSDAPIVEASGYEIASGNNALRDLQNMGSMFGGNSEMDNRETSSPLLWFILVFGIIGLISINGRHSGTISAIMAGILGIIGMIIFSVLISEFGEELSREGLKLRFQEGFWMTWIGFAWLTLSGIMTSQQRR